MKNFRQLDVIYTDFERAAFSFRSNANAVHSLLAAPVPFPYFHVVKVMLVITLVVIGYAMVDLLHGRTSTTIVVFWIICTVMIGLQEIAAAMSDPFGDDDIDFDTERLLRSAFNDAISLLRDERQVSEATLPIEFGGNPLRQQGLVTWKAPDDFGEAFSSGGLGGATRKVGVAKAALV